MDEDTLTFCYRSAETDLPLGELMRRKQVIKQ